MDTNLASFVKFLEASKLLEFDVDGDDDSHFYNRLKLQKYVYIAKHLGMPFKYNYGIYLYGPYSRDLAADYYELAQDWHERRSKSSVALPNRFNESRFLEVNHNNNPKWLEVATTIIDRNKKIKNRDGLTENVWNIKSHFEKKFIIEVLSDLEKHRLVSTRA